jgi:hypothetical protein
MRWDRLSPRIRPKAAAVLLTLFVALGAAQMTQAQPQFPSFLPSPRLFTLFPCGAKAGTSVEVTFTGLDLEETKEIVFSHPDIKATPVVAANPAQPKPNPKKPPRPRGRRNMGQPSATRFKITVGDKVRVGFYDARLINKWGISNARTFVVGDLTEVAEKEPNNDVEQAQRVEINTTVNGVISAGTDVDYYVFKGKKGQRVVVSCLAASIDSRLEADLRLLNPDGKQLASSQNYDGTDALLDATLPEDGDYYVRVSQQTYTFGNAEYFYRVSITTAPWIDAIHPCTIEPGKEAKVTVYGRNLPGGKLDKSAVVDGKVLEKVTVTIKAPDDKAARHRLAYSGRKRTTSLSLDGFEYRIKNKSGTSNPFLITYAMAPVVLDNEANDTPETAQEITLPCEVAGRIEKRRDRDWYAFTAKKGEVWNIEVFSDRLGAPTDMYFLLHNPKTKQDMAEVDQHTESLGFSGKYNAVTEDPGVYRFTAPADGKYLIMVASQTGDTLAGPRHFYRLRITEPKPDFHVVVMPPDSNRPDGCCVRQGGNAYYSAFAWRHDGFAGDITLTAENLPKGVTCPAQTLGGSVRSASLGVSAAADAPEWAGQIKFKATAKINGKTVEREVRYASINWPSPFFGANFPMFTRLDHGLALAVRDKAPFKITASLDKATVTQGGKLTVPLKLERLWPDFKNQIQIFPNFREIPPQVLTHGVVTFPAGKTDANLVLNINFNAQPGTYNLVFRGFGPVPFNRDPKSKFKPNINVVQPSTPLALTILPKQIARVSLSNGNPSVKVGQQVEVVVRVNRMFNYDGEFKVQLVLPANVKGVSAEEVTIPAGKNEAKLVIKAEGDAQPGNRGNLTVKTTGMYNGTSPLTQTNQINVNVVK